MYMEVRKVTAIIGARVSSTRLPGKVIMPLAGKPMLERLVERVRRAKFVGDIVLGTTVKAIDDELIRLAKKIGIKYFRGSEEDVLGRVAGAICQFQSEAVLFLTGDNPLIDPLLIDDVIDFFYTGNYDYVSSSHMHHSRHWKAERTFPIGVSVHVVKADVLLGIEKEITDANVREHATLGVYDRSDNMYKLGAFQAEGDYREWRHPELRFTVDTLKDYELMRLIFQELYPANPNFSTLEAIRLVLIDPALKSINAAVQQEFAGH